MMSDPQEPWAAPDPAPSIAPTRRRRPAVLAAAVVVVTVAVVIGWLLADGSDDISQKTAYDRVNKATQALATMLGLDLAQHPTFAVVTHCDNGAGGYSGWSVDGGSSIEAVTPDQAAELGKRLEAALHSAGDSDVKLTIDGPNVDLRSHYADAKVYLNYRPSDTKDLLQFGATTDCNVTPGPHDFEHDGGYPLTDDQGHLLPSPGTGTST